jgi:hypothetical protein
MATLKSVIRSLKAQRKSILQTVERLNLDAEKIGAGIAALGAGKPGRPKGSKPKRKMSAAARAKISRAQKKRWKLAASKTKSAAAAA